MKTSELIGAVLDWAVAKCEEFKPCAVYGRGAVRDSGFALPTSRGYEAALLRPSHDSWCAKCEDYPWSKHQVVWEPTKKWSQGGPIIEREGINTFKYNKLDEREPDKWGAHKVVPRKAMDNVEYSAALCLDGPTPLIAAMRCYVASKLGDEVEIPSELLS